MIFKVQNVNNKNKHKLIWVDLYKTLHDVYTTHSLTRSLRSLVRSIALAKCTIHIVSDFQIIFIGICNRLNAFEISMILHDFQLH